MQLSDSGDEEAAVSVTPPRCSATVNAALTKEEDAASSEVSTGYWKIDFRPSGNMLRYHIPKLR